MFCTNRHLTVGNKIKYRIEDFSVNSLGPETIKKKKKAKTELFRSANSCLLSTYQKLEALVNEGLSTN